MKDPFLGILMLNTGFPRPPGDVGNPASWPIAVRFNKVTAARRDNVVVREKLGDELFEAFVTEADRLIEQGAKALVTSCGFLAPLQDRLSERLAVPVLASALSEVSWVQESLPQGQRVGVLTYDSRVLSGDHLAAVGAPRDCPVAGVEGGRELFSVIAEDRPELNHEAAEADVLQAAHSLLQAHPSVTAIVMECTNMGPYKASLERQTGLPVHDIVSATLRRFSHLFASSS